MNIVIGWCRQCGLSFKTAAELIAHEDSGECQGVSVHRQRCGRMAHQPQEAAA